ncbi:MAG TPA: PspC domain-containing protein, partial [Candidatus Paceibacterota bacterium]
VMATMGKVEDFASASAADTAETGEEKKAKKLYRDLDKKIIAGVCSGLGAYVGMDPIWVRLIFVALALITHGFAILLYIVLAVIIPAARTASQKLEMEGSPVTLDTISKNVKDKANEISQKHGSTFMRVIAAPFAALKWVVDIIVRRIGPVLRILVGIVLAAAAIAGMIVLTFLAPVSLINGSTYVGFPITEVVSPGLFYAAISTAYVALIIPCVVVFMLAVSLLRRKMFLRSGLALTLLFVWCVAVAGAGVAGVTTGGRISNDQRVRAIYHAQTIEYPLAAGLENISAAGSMRVTYVQGPTPTLRISGRKAALDTVATSSTGTTLNLSRSEMPHTNCIFCEANWIEATVTLPELTSATLDDSADFSADRWTSESPISVTAHRNSYVDIDVRVPHITVSAQGAYVRVSGTASTTSFDESADGRIRTNELNAVKEVQD